MRVRDFIQCDKDARAISGLVDRLKLKDLDAVEHRVLTANTEIAKRDGAIATLNAMNTAAETERDAARKREMMLRIELDSLKNARAAAWQPHQYVGVGLAVAAVGLTVYATATSSWSLNRLGEVAVLGGGAGGLILVRF